MPRQVGFGGGKAQPSCGQQASELKGSWQGGVQTGHSSGVGDSQTGSVLAATQEEMAQLVMVATVSMYVLYTDRAKWMIGVTRSPAGPEADGL